MRPIHRISALWMCPQITACRERRVASWTREASKSATKLTARLLFHFT